MEHNCYLYMFNIKKFTFTLLLSFIHKIKHIFKQLKKVSLAFIFQCCSLLSRCLYIFV